MELNPLFQIKFNTEQPTLSLLLENASYQIPSDHCVRLILAIAEAGPSTRHELIKSMRAIVSGDELEVENILDEFLSNRILIPSDEAALNKSGIRHWIDRGWLDALVLHLQTRNVSYDDDNQACINEITTPVSIPYTRRRPIKNVLTKISLPKPITGDQTEYLDVVNALMKRRSFRPFTNPPISINQLSECLWHSNVYGVERTIQLEQNLDNQELIYDSAFSALETFLVIHKSSELATGVYYYDKFEHELHQVKNGDYSDNLAEACVGQKRASQGSVSFVLVADYHRYSSRYHHSRAYRNLLINTAELAQLYLIQLTSVGLHTFMTPALKDEVLHELLEIDGSIEIPLYVLAAG